MKSHHPSWELCVMRLELFNISLYNKFTITFHTPAVPRSKVLRNASSKSAIEFCVHIISTVNSTIECKNMHEISRPHDL